MLSGRRPNTADPWSIAAWWMVSDQASFPPTQLFFCIGGITGDDGDLVNDDSTPYNRSHGLKPQFLLRKM
ncbi:unnamed protein product [Urochloa decumbens]|uniref:Uncharacterized protein n=1 Tax=Urochloa decumbens TaxID=240449 RepID=A0ABC8WMV7_9POAL